MRVLCLTLAGLLAGSTFLFAQAPAQPPAADPRLDQLLANWEKTMSGLASLYAECTRRETDKAFGTTAEYTGWAKYLKSGVPNLPSRAALRMERKDRKDIFEQYIFTGTYLYEFVPQQKVIRVHKLPATKNGQVGNDSMLGFMFGMTAADAKRRYHLTYQTPDPKDVHWFYIGIQAKETADKADFSEARLVLSQKDFLPRQLYYKQPNENTVVWDFKVIPGVKINALEFQAPNPLPGWRFEHMTREPPPRVTRPNQ